MHCSIEHGGFEHELKAILGAGVGSAEPANAERSALPTPERGTQ
jgi:hypothetical protein